MPLTPFQREVDTDYLSYASGALTMTESLLTFVREKQAEATRKAVKSWQRHGLPKSKQARDRHASDLGQLFALFISDWERDREMVRALIREAANHPPEDIDRVNEFLQKYLKAVIDTLRALSGMAAELEKAGHPVAGLEAIAPLLAEYARRREDLPEQFALASRQVGPRLRKRVAKVLRTPYPAVELTHIRGGRQGTVLDT
jgi:hypothetical protein